MVDISTQALKDVLPSGSQLHKNSDLPMVKIVRNNITYRVTDLRMLDSEVLQFCKHIIDRICKHSDYANIVFNVTGMEEDRVWMIVDVITGIEVKSSKGMFLLLPCDAEYMECKDGSKILNFTLIGDSAKAIYECAKGKATINYYELALDVAEWKQKQIIIKSFLREELGHE